MLGGMQDFELRVPRLIEHAEREHGRREIVTQWADGSQTRTNWAGIARDARKLAQALEKLGCKRGDRIATLAMNHSRHLVAWYGAIGMGGVIHTINPRLFDEQLVYIANHAEDRVLFYDKVFQPIVDRLRDQWTTIDHYVCFDDGAFEALTAAEDGDYQWVEGSEREPCMLCYTSGTTAIPGRALRAPLLADPRHGRGRAVLLRSRAVVGGAADRADVPRRRLGPALRRGDRRDQIRLFGGQRSHRPVPPDERGESHPFGGRSHRLARHVPAYGRDRRGASPPQDRHHWRLGRAAHDDRTADEARHPRRPRLGDDGDLADRYDWVAARRLGRNELRRAGRSGDEAGPGALRRRAAGDRRRGHCAAARRQELRPPQDPRPLGDPPLFPGRKRRLRGRVGLVRHRRRRRHPPVRDDADHRSRRRT